MNWHYEKDGTAVGPVDEATLAELAKSGAISLKTLVWNETMMGWKPIRETDLASLLHTNAATPPLPARPPKIYPESAYMKPRLPLRSSHCSWWNLLDPGIGHILLGQEKKGLFLIVISFVLPLLVRIKEPEWSLDGDNCEIAIFLLVAIIAIVDGYMVGHCLHNGRRVRHWQWFPTIAKTVPEKKSQLTDA